MKPPQSEKYQQSQSGETSLRGRNDSQGDEAGVNTAAGDSLHSDPSTSSTTSPLPCLLLPPPTGKLAFFITHFKYTSERCSERARPLWVSLAWVFEDSLTGFIQCTLSAAGDPGIVFDTTHLLPSLMCPPPPPHHHRHHHPRSLRKKGGGSRRMQM